MFVLYIYLIYILETELSGGRGGGGWVRGGRIRTSWGRFGGGFGSEEFFLDA